MSFLSDNADMARPKDMVDLYGVLNLNKSILARNNVVLRVSPISSRWFFISLPPLSLCFFFKGSTTSLEVRSNSIYLIIHPLWPLPAPENGDQTTIVHN